jgi:hypothetical protein
MKEIDNTFNPSSTSKLEADIERVQSRTRSYKNPVKTFDTDSDY